MRSTGYAPRFISRWWAVIGGFLSSLFRREAAPSAVRCFTNFLLCFLIDDIHASGIFNSAAPVNVIRVKSYMDSFLDLMGLRVRVSINILRLVPKQIMAGPVGVLRNGGGLGTCESYIPVVLFDSLMYRSPCLAGSTVSLGRTKCDLSIVSDLKTVRMPCYSRQRRRGSDTPCR